MELHDDILDLVDQKDMRDGKFSCSGVCAIGDYLNSCELLEKKLNKE